MHIITIADLVRIMRDIDVIKGRVCGACRFRPDLASALRRQYCCQKGYVTASPDDSCDDWQARPPDEAA